jgi:hypothetical protein
VKHSSHSHDDEEDEEEDDDDDDDDRDPNNSSGYETPFPEQLKAEAASASMAAVLVHEVSSTLGGDVPAPP